LNPTTPKRTNLLSLENTLVMLALFILAFNLYASLFWVPYLGFQFNQTANEITSVTPHSSAASVLQAGDRILAVNGVDFQARRHNRAVPLFPLSELQEGIELTILRGETILTVPLDPIPLPTPRQLFYRLMDTPALLVVGIFLLVGAATVLLVRPKDTRWALLIAFYYLTAGWVGFGALSSWHVLYSYHLYHICFWLSMPVYLHLHWEFPQPFRPLPRQFWAAIYLVGLGVLVFDLLFRIPGIWLVLVLVVIAIVCITLLALHYRKQPNLRSDFGPFLIAVLIFVVPALALGLAVVFGRLSFDESGLLIMFMPALPLTYFLTSYRRQLGGLEVCANRFLSLVLYSVGLISISILIVALVNTTIGPQVDEESLANYDLLVILLVILTGLSSVLLYPTFQRRVERHLLKIPLPPTGILETYAARISSSLEFKELTRLLSKEVLPSLSIRQAAIVPVDPPETGEKALRQRPYLLMQVEPEQLPQRAECYRLLAQAGRYRPFMDDLDPCPWVRLALPLKFDRKTIGLALFGRRDPDDKYASTEIPVLQALMDQTVIALQAIKQANDLRTLFQRDIEREEKARMSLARELHDGVLGQMTALAAIVAGSSVLPQFAPLYQTTIQQIREIISGLRPSMLEFGLRSALDELVDEITALAPPDAALRVEINVPDSQERYPLEVEAHLCRIVQQACQNAVQHSKAQWIRIEGVLEPQKVFLQIQDNGTGFDIGERSDLAWLLSRKHFGLAGMHERAVLIGARLVLDSTPGPGTRVSVYWDGSSGSRDGAAPE
jgi:signal transduction histidine kinase